MKKITIEYFALFREHAGIASESRETAVATAGELFAELAAQYQFPTVKTVKVAINDEFALWDDAIKDGDSIVFIPPVAGG